MLTTYILQQRNILENNTDYQCSGLFKRQGQGYFNCSITHAHVHTHAHTQHMYTQCHTRMHTYTSWTKEIFELK